MEPEGLERKKKERRKNTRGYKWQREVDQNIDYETLTDLHHLVVVPKVRGVVPRVRDHGHQHQHGVGQEVEREEYLLHLREDVSRHAEEQSQACTGRTRKCSVIGENF